ncbi:hypothetical protein [Paenibacillus tianmuensis]|uniref:hypothetical protein n=1 Tax=Paenibacillus tianmuensis TaxID=624147 RepID=UPI00115FBD7E|nr:hypothetical protein [Paenibacillus tianmuensis]
MITVGPLKWTSGDWFSNVSDAASAFGADSAGVVKAAAITTARNFVKVAFLFFIAFSPLIL